MTKKNLIILCLAKLSREIFETKDELARKEKSKKTLAQELVDACKHIKVIAMEEQEEGEGFIATELKLFCLGCGYEETINPNNPIKTRTTLSAEKAKKVSKENYQKIRKETRISLGLDYALK